eukprot:4768710-Prymnesium_polylepis.1
MSVQVPGGDGADGAGSDSALESLKFWIPQNAPVRAPVRPVGILLVMRMVALGAKWDAVKSTSKLPSSPCPQKLASPHWPPWPSLNANTRRCA